MAKSITSRQLKAALALLAWKVEDLAAAAAVSEPTIWRLETANDTLDAERLASVKKIIAALERAGIEFQNHGEPGVRLRKRRRK